MKMVDEIFGNKLAAVPLLALIFSLLLLMLFVGYKEYTYPYNHSWFYRTFLNPSYNISYTVNVKLDGEPYKIKRIIRCERFMSDRQSRSYSFSPEYRSFGVKAKTGEGIIVTTPGMCGRRETYEKEWTFEVPKDYLPLISIADNADDPAVITVYASRTAYRTEPRRLEFVGLEIKQPKGWESLRWGRSKPDKFRFLGNGQEVVNYEIRWGGAKTGVIKRWLYHSFTVVPKEYWMRDYGVKHFTEEKKQEVLNKQESGRLDTALCSFIATPWVYSGGTRYTMEGALYGAGLAPGPSLSGESIDEFVFDYFFDHILPYDLKEDIWEPDYKNIGKIKLFNPDKFTDTASRPAIDTGTVVFTQIIINGETVDYKHSKNKNSSSVFGCLYSYKDQSVYMPMNWNIWNYQY